MSEAPFKATFPSAHFGKKSTMYSPRRSSCSFAGARVSFLAGCAAYSSARSTVESSRGLGLRGPLRALGGTFGSRSARTGIYAPHRRQSASAAALTRNEALSLPSRRRTDLRFRNDELAAARRVARLQFALLMALRTGLSVRSRALWPPPYGLNQRLASHQPSSGERAGALGLESVVRCTEQSPGPSSKSGSRAPRK